LYDKRQKKQVQKDWAKRSEQRIELYGDDIKGYVGEDETTRNMNRTLGIALAWSDRDLSMGVVKKTVFPSPRVI
jgi:hypothetical protein